MSAPGWTAADEAELAVLITEFIASVHEHRERCSTCSTGGPYCNGLREAWDVVVDFKRRRELYSTAVFLRARQRLADVEQGVAPSSTAHGAAA